MQKTQNTSVLFTAILLLAASGNTANSEEATPATIWHAQSTDAIYNASVRPIGKIEIGHFQNWIIRVVDAANRPVYPARIAVGGGMAGHGHGLPTQPQVTAYGGDGEYLIEGLRFSMEGDWRLSFVIESDLGVDRISFEIKVVY